MKLVFGVVDAPYQGAPRGKRAKRTASNVTTGDVAEILEDKYQIMERFFDLHGAEIAQALERSVQGGIENLLTGEASLGIDVFGEAMSEIETMFRHMLDTRELDGKVPGVPTAAAERGVSHRRAHPYALRDPRPSFIDTGEFQAAFRAWMSE